jgi:hypothetical protein
VTFNASSTATLDRSFAWQWQQPQLLLWLDHRILALQLVFEMQQAYMQYMDMCDGK